MIYFTADTHFFHKNIIKHAERPFASVEEMNNTIITNINDVVKSDDWLYHLGDFAFCNDWQSLYELRKRIKCANIVLITGNHDKIIKKHKSLLLSGNWFNEIHYSYLERKFDDCEITMCHYAMKIWNKCHYGTFHLYGHSHGTLPDDPNSLSFDVGVDAQGFAPVSLAKVKEIMLTKQFKPIDRHGANENLLIQ